MSGEKVQGAILAVSSAEAAADTVISATQASPIVLGATSHGIVAGKIVRVTGVGGMTEINDRAFVVGTVATSTLELKGINGTGYTAFTSGGSIFEQTMLDIGYLDKVGPGFNGSSTEIPTTHLRSRAMEFQGGLPDFGEMPFSFLDTAGDTGQLRLQVLHETQAVVAWSITLPSGRKAAFLGFVKQLGFEEIAPDAVLRGSGIIRVSNYPARFA